METRRTTQFLRFALGARSPEKRTYYKPKMYIAPEETRLKVNKSQNRTSYERKQPDAEKLEGGGGGKERAKTTYKGNPNW